MYHYARLEPPLWLNYSFANLELELYLTFGPDRSISLQSLLKSHTHGLQREPSPLSLSQVNGGLPQFLANTFTSEAMQLPLLFMQQPSTLKASESPAGGGTAKAVLPAHPVPWQGAFLCPTFSSFIGLNSAFSLYSALTQDAC